MWVRLMHKHKQCKTKRMHFKSYFQQNQTLRDIDTPQPYRESGSWAALFLL